MTYSHPHDAQEYLYSNRPHKFLLALAHVINEKDQWNMGELYHEVTNRGYKRTSKSLQKDIKLLAKQGIIQTRVYRGAGGATTKIRPVKEKMNVLKTIIA